MMKLELKEKRDISTEARRIKAKDGFTLLEVIIAISILTVGLLSIASMQVSSIRGNFFADGVTEGTTWAADRLEKFIDMAVQDYDDTNLQDTDVDGEAGLNHTAASADYSETEGRYTIYWNVAEDALMLDTKTIWVIVTWTDHGVEKSVTMQHVVPRII